MTPTTHLPRRCAIPRVRAGIRALIAVVLPLFYALPGHADPTPTDSAGAFPDSLPAYEIREPVEVTANKLSLREIIRRSVEGERTKLSGHHDMTYTAQSRAILTWERKRREIVDRVYLVYEDDRGTLKRVQLTEDKQTFDYRDDQWKPRAKQDDKDASVEVEVETSDRGGDLAQLPFFLKDQEEYDFELLERRLERDHVIFKIAFRPRSRFKPLPSGTVYVDTNAFRIVHETFTFEENPAPLLLKGIRGISRQWTELPGGEWVTSRILGELELQGGWTGLIPGNVEFSVVLSDYHFDRGYDERRFGPYGDP